MSDDVMELGLRERKKRAARIAIRRKALELVAERGICGVSVDDIAVAAGVSPRTFFNYYASKDEALFTPAEDRLEAADAVIARADRSLGPLGGAHDAMLDLMDERKHDLTPVRLRRRILEREPALIGSFLRVSMSTQAHWVARLHERFADHDPPLPEGYVELVLTSTWAAAGTALSVWGAGGHAEPLLDILRRQLDQLSAGLAHPLSNS
ncbi:MAG: TetR/AcrR family transcriptional regulator [Cumulibacter sp.]